TDFAVLRPRSDLDPTAPYTAKLDSTINAADGTPLAASVSWSFSTGNAPPSVDARSPYSGLHTSDVSILAHVTATFSRAMDASTITSSSFTLESYGVPVPASVSYDTNTNTAVLTPNLPLAPNASHDVLLKTTIKAADGVPLHYPVGWQFDTEAANTPTGTSVPVHTADPISGTAIDVTFENVSV